ncbi:MAG TPA: hypothetical protein VHI52_21070 [Verrucomicrobiae bacterium]|nr:hypothetical protein [Verrucomicrobiae bacterium]
MIDTNLLLGIVFSIITNDMSRVPAPDDCIPKSINDIRIKGVGSPNSPIDIAVQCRGGAHYIISDGIVHNFNSNRSVFREQNPDRLDAYEGISIVNSNQALTIASNVLQRFIKPGFALRKAIPRIHQAGVYDWLPPSQQHPMPFYEVEWPSVSDCPCGAIVDIDGRNGKVVQLFLCDIAYSDFARAEKIKSQVYHPEADQRPKPVRETYIAMMQKHHYPPPTEAYAREAIPKWLSFCRKIGCDPGSQTNVSDIRWDASWVHTNLLTGPPVCEIRFKNGVYFHSIQGVTLSHYCADACFTGLWGERPRQEWAPWWAKCTKDWKDWKALAKALEPVLVEQLGIPKELLARYHPMPGVKPPEPGKWGYTRLLVQWRDFPLVGEVAVSDTKLGFQAEFDLQTGALKWLSFFPGEDPRFRDALRAAASSRP